MNHKLSIGDVVYYQPLNISGEITKIYSFGESCTVYFPEEKMELGVLSCHLISSDDIAEHLKSAIADSVELGNRIRDPVYQSCPPFDISDLIRE